MSVWMIELCLGHMRVYVWMSVHIDIRICLLLVLRMVICVRGHRVDRWPHVRIGVHKCMRIRVCMVTVLLSIWLWLAGCRWIIRFFNDGLGYWWIDCAIWLFIIWIELDDQWIGTRRVWSDQTLLSTFSIGLVRIYPSERFTSAKEWETDELTDQSLKSIVKNFASVRWTAKKIMLRQQHQRLT